MIDIINNNDKNSSNNLVNRWGVYNLGNGSWNIYIRGDGFGNGNWPFIEIGDGNIYKLNHLKGRGVGAYLLNLYGDNKGGGKSRVK